MKNNKKNALIYTALLTCLPLKNAQANIISFDIEVDRSYERVIERNRDGSRSDNVDWTNLNPVRFSTQIDFDLFSEQNKTQMPGEHQFESNGNDLAWWMTTFDYPSQEIYTPFESALLGQVTLDDYEDLYEQRFILAGGLYHYYDPQDDSDVRESIEFRREFHGVTHTKVNGGEVETSFTYWQDFTIDLPNPLSFDTKTYFDSYSTDEILASFSGASVRFETYVTKREWWNNDANTEFSYNSVQNAYRGQGTYSYQSVSVPEPSTFALLLPFAAMCFSLRKRKLASK